MPLKLVTGPANAAKAGEILGGLRARLNEEPVLVVPGFEDVEHNQRELARRGAVFGARVLRFGAFFGLLARRTGTAARTASDLQRSLIVAEAIAASELVVLADSAARPGFARALGRFVAELERSMVEPARLTVALRRWAADGPRAAYAEEVAELYRRYRAGLEAAGLVDEDLLAWRAVDALAADPSAWDGTPVFLYGFDDFTRVELEALKALSKAAEVAVSLPYEGGREAFAAVRAVRDELAAEADEVIVLEAADDHYAKASKRALHALERGLFEPGARTADPGAVVRLHSAGGERAEVELCGAEVLRLLREGTPAGDVAVVFRDPPRYASLVEQVFGAYGIPYSIDRKAPLSHTAIGRGLLALLRAARLDGTTERRHIGRAGARAVGGRARAVRARRDRPAGGGRRAGGADRRARAPARAVVRRSLSRASSRAGGRRARGPARVPRRGRGAASARGGQPGRRRRDRARRARVAAGPDGGDGAARPRPGRLPRADPRATVRRGAGLWAAGGRVPARRADRSLPVRRRPAFARERVWLAVAVARARARPRAPPLLRLRLARRAGARPELALLRRGGRRRAALVPRRRCPRRPARARRHGASPVAVRRHLGPAGRSDSRRVGAGPRAARAASPAGARRATDVAARARDARRVEDRLRQRARALRVVPGQVARRGRAATREARAGPRADGPRLLRPQGPRADLPAPARADRLAPRHAGEPP